MQLILRNHPPCEYPRVFLLGAMWTTCPFSEEAVMQGFRAVTCVTVTIPVLRHCRPGHSICPAAARDAALDLPWRSRTQGSLFLQKLRVLPVSTRMCKHMGPQTLWLLEPEGKSDYECCEFSFSGVQPLVWVLNVPVPLRWLRCRWHHWSHIVRQPAIPGAEWMQQSWLPLQHLPAVSHR